MLHTSPTEHASADADNGSQGKDKNSRQCNLLGEIFTPYCYDGWVEDAGQTLAPLMGHLQCVAEYFGSLATTSSERQPALHIIQGGKCFA